MNDPARAEEAAPRPVRFSLIVPAWNEAALLPRLLDSVAVARARAPGPVETIVADNDSTDRTAALAAARGCRVVRVEKRRIAAARNGGAAAARGEILCFVDADSRIHPDTFRMVERTLGPDVVAGASGVRMERWSVGIVATWLLLIPLVVVLRMDTGVVFCRRRDFEAVGGYDERRWFGEDLAFLVALRRLGRPRGQRLARGRGAKTVTSARKFDEHGDWHFFRLLGNMGLRFVRDPGRVEDWIRRHWYEGR